MTMKYLKLFENFDQSLVQEFMDIVRDKILDLSDIGFNVRVEDKNSEPLLEDMIRITIDRLGMSKSFQFKECSYIVSDILLTNIEMELYKKVHVLIQPEWRDNNKSERLSWIFTQGEEEAIWSFENKRVSWANPLNLSIKRVEIFFE
jgi:hypothetical protein